ncbi:hypothetical protein INR49_000183 [Caranx melampygus]|nr:hypothetical protein INR49_000183 [Caranx melampygus]
MRRCCEMLRAETSSAMELVLPLLCLCVLSCSGSTSAAGAEPERINVKEGRDVILPCSTTEDITTKRFVGRKMGQQQGHLSDQLKQQGPGHCCGQSKMRVPKDN